MLSTGLPKRVVRVTQKFKLDSPFDYARQAAFYVPLHLTAR
jgi:hypothetical protein